MSSLYYTIPTTSSLPCVNYGNSSFYQRNYCANDKDLYTSEVYRLLNSQDPFGSNNETQTWIGKYSFPNNNRVEIEKITSFDFLFEHPQNKYKLKSFYDEAVELFGGEIRGFTEEESKKYKEGLKRIYKPTGVNIFNL